jgi:hypothetical protein
MSWRMRLVMGANMSATSLSHLLMEERFTGTLDVRPLLSDNSAREQSAYGPHQRMRIFFLPFRRTSHNFPVE